MKLFCFLGRGSVVGGKLKGVREGGSVSEVEGGGVEGECGVWMVEFSPFFAQTKALRLRDNHKW